MSNNEGVFEERRRQREQARQAEQRQRLEEELLQIALASLERGKPLEVLGRPGTPARGMPAEELQDLRDLLQLATVLRNLPNPSPRLDLNRQFNAHLAVQAGMIGCNDRNHSHKRKTTMQSENITKSRRQATNSPPESASLRPQSRSRRPSLLNSLSMLLVFAILLTGFGLYLAGPRNANAATLMEINGQVEALTTGGVWSALAEGDRVQSGQQLRTGPASQATLVFFDGTRTSLEPNTDVTLSQVEGDWGSVLRVSLTQNAGHTRHSVVPLRGEHSAFTVLTPTGAASVHGTFFDVAVNSSGISRFGVETGRVLVSSEQGEAFLTAGQVTSVRVDGVVEEPAYQFSLQGTLTSVTGSTWIVDGVPFTVTDQTTYTGLGSDGPQVGDEVLVTGRVLAGGEWVADSLTETMPGESTTSTFTGELESISGDIWQVSGWTVQVDDSTDIAGGIEVGDPVRVTFRLLEDGLWLAVRIESLAEPNDGQPETDPDALPELVFSPAELQAGVCEGVNVSLEGALTEMAGYAAMGVELSTQVVDGELYLASWEITPRSFTEISANGSANFIVNLVLNDDWPGAEDAEIKLRVFASSENYSDLFDSRLTVTVENNCGEIEQPEETQTEAPTDTVTPTDTPDLTETPTVTETPTNTPDLTETPMVTEMPTDTPDLTETPTVTETPSDTPDLTETICTGAQPHPTGTRLAARYSATYEEIMGWFCQGFGFGEIELAYSLSWASQNMHNYKTPAEIFAMKASGMGWGEIKNFFEMRGNPKKDPTASPEPALPTTESSTPEASSTAAPTEEYPTGQVTQGPSQPPGNPTGKPEKTPKPPNPNKP
jgi:hypothetical protein